MLLKPAVLATAATVSAQYVFENEAHKNVAREFCGNFSTSPAWDCQKHLLRHCRRLENRGLMNFSGCLDLEDLDDFKFCLAGCASLTKDLSNVHFKNVELYEFFANRPSTYNFEEYFGNINDIKDFAYRRGCYNACRANNERWRDFTQCRDVCRDLATENEATCLEGGSGNDRVVGETVDCLLGNVEAIADRLENVNDFSSNVKKDGFSVDAGAFGEAGLNQGGVDVVTILEAAEVIDRQKMSDDKIWQIKEKNINKSANKASDLFQFFKRPDNEESQKAARCGEITNSVMQKLRKMYIRHQSENQSRSKRSVSNANKNALMDNFPEDFLPTLFNIAECGKKDSVCDVDQCADYRTISGECNNLRRPKWGSSNQPLERWLPANYEDSFSQAVGWDSSKTYNGFHLPDVREVSNLIAAITTAANRDPRLSHMSVVYGQYLDHDLDLTPLSQNGLTADGQACSDLCNNVEPCFPIGLQNDDPKIVNNLTDKTCLPFTRSASTIGSDAIYEASKSISKNFKLENLLKPVFQRQQLNVITNFVDASTVYGSTDSAAANLRAFDGKGRLRVNENYTDNGFDLLPEQPDVGMCLNSEARNEAGNPVKCWLAGDGRVAEHLTLSSVHTLWVREHNRIAEYLAALNPQWGEETLYQETRKIVIAEHQKVFIDEYYPAILGENAPAYSGYDWKVNPSVPHAFATAAFRFGHSTIHPLVMRLDENFEESADHETLNLHNAFFQPWRIVDEGGLDPLLRGLIDAGAKITESANIMSDEVREKLFMIANKVGFDLAAMNMQRGRDHGLAFYNDWREFCELPRHNDFTDIELSTHLTQDEQADIYQKLEDLYGSVDNIDFWIGALLENLEDDAAVGATNKCIIKKTFLNAREGDRYWYQKKNVFTFEQRANLEQASFSRVICENSGLNTIQPRALEREARTECDNLPSLDLDLWKERPVCSIDSIPGLDLDVVGFKNCESNDKKIIFECKKAGQKLVGASYAICRNGQYDLVSRKKKFGKKPVIAAAPTCVDA